MIKTEDCFGNEVTIGDYVIVNDYRTDLKLIKVEAIDQTNRKVGIFYYRSTWSSTQKQWIKSDSHSISWINKDFVIYKGK